MARLLRFALLSLLLLALAPASALASPHNITIVAGSGTSDFTVTTGAAGTTYTANTDSAQLGADAITGSLATGDVTVQSGSGGSQPGLLTVSSAISTAATTTLNLSPDADLTVGAPIDIGGEVELDSPSILLDSDVTSEGGDVTFSGPVTLTGDSSVTATAGHVGMSGTLDGAFGLTVDAGSGLSLGFTGGAIEPTSLSVTGNTTMAADSVQVNGPLTFNGDVSRAGTANLRASDFHLYGTLTADDVSVVPTGVATFEDGSVLGTEAAPLKSIEVDGATSFGDTTVRTSGGSQVWNGPVTVSGSASVIAATDQVTFVSTVDGPGSLSVDTNSNPLSFDDSIGLFTPLTDLTISGTQTTSFTGNTLAAGSASFAGLNWTPVLSTPALSVGSLSAGAGGITLPNFPSRTLTVTGGGSISGPITGTQLSLVKAGTGTLALGGSNTYEGLTTVNAGELRVSGLVTGDVALNNGSILSGAGTVGGNVTSTGSQVSPGASPGILSVSNDVSFDATSTYSVELNGTTAGTGYDQLAVDGQLTLGGAALHVTAADSLPLGQPLTIIDKTSGLDVDGTFAGKPEGAVFDVGRVRLQISYKAGAPDNNNVTLTRVRQPTTLALTSGPASVTEGSPVTLTATVGGPAGTPTPTGTVTFKDGSAVLGTAPVSNGVASLTTSALPAGDHALTAAFASDFYEASSASASQHVDATPAPVTQQPPAQTPPPPTSSQEPPVTVKVADAKGKEKPKPGFVTFVVTLSKASSKTVTVKFATKDGSAKSRKDFKAANGTLTFKPGQTRLLVKVRIVNDKVKEKTEKFSLKLSAPSGATLARGTATGTITDDD